MVTPTDRKNKQTTGAWLIHHDQKLAGATSQEFPSIVTAGRAARLLSLLSREVESQVTKQRAEQLSLANGISIPEMRGLTQELKDHGLIDIAAGGIAVLGVTQSNLLTHAADMFEAQDPSGFERAAIDLAEVASDQPVRQSECAEHISDTFGLTGQEVTDLFNQAEAIGFVDWESDGGERLYFNGSLFKRDTARKAANVLSSLKPDEVQRLAQLDGLMERTGCLPVETVISTLSESLFHRLHQVGFYEVSTVRNERGDTQFVTKPNALAKFVPNGLADVLDDAKALSSSLAYGIMKSSSARGRIRDPEVLIDVLIGRGYVEGHASALSQDYTILERRSVVQVTSSSRGNRLTLLKPEVGRMARDLVLKGDATSIAVQSAIGQAAPTFAGPEPTRMAARKRVVEDSPSRVISTLNALRTRF